MLPPPRLFVHYLDRLQGLLERAGGHAARFHSCMVYAIARQAGVPVGKADFDGFHDYPPGFAFPSAT